MKTKIVLSLFCISMLLLSSCKESQAREPISQSRTASIDASVERNKKLVKKEEAQIDSIIKSNPKIKYIASQKGYWYHYDVRNENDTLRPRKGDIAYFNYHVKDLKGNVIYTENDLKPQIYTVDKQNIMMGLRHGIKLMHKTEKVTFLFPSHMAYGYHGDNEKIGTNVPLICSVTLNDFKPEKK
jgi:gliding motility-associated peptidyl-prolyl isomerase